MHVRIINTRELKQFYTTTLKYQQTSPQDKTEYNGNALALIHRSCLIQDANLKL